MSVRTRPCKEMGENISPTAFGFRRVCGLGLGTNGTCCLGKEAVRCKSYVKKPTPQMEAIQQRRLIRLAQVDDGPDLERGVVRDDDKLEVELLGKGHEEVADLEPIPLPPAGELEGLVEDE